MYNPKWIRLAIDTTRTLFRWVPPTMEELLRTTRKLIATSEKSLLSSSDTMPLSNQEPSMDSIGQTFMSNSTAYVKQLNNTQESTESKKKNIMTSALTTPKTGVIPTTAYREVEKTTMDNYFASYDKQANYKGNGHDTIYQRMDCYVDYLISQQILYPENKIGRIKVGNYTRTGLNVSIGMIVEKKETIIQALTDHYGINGKEVYELLLQGACSAAYTGLVELYDTQLNTFCKFIQYAPPHLQCLIMGSPKTRNHMLKSMAA